jgi:hypothetical protein
MKHIKLFLIPLLVSLGFFGTAFAQYNYQGYQNSNYTTYTSGCYTYRYDTYTGVSTIIGNTCNQNQQNYGQNTTYQYVAPITYTYTVPPVTTYQNTNGYATNNYTNQYQNYQWYYPSQTQTGYNTQYYNQNYTYNGQYQNYGQNYTNQYYNQNYTNQNQLYGCLWYNGLQVCY